MPGTVLIVEDHEDTRHTLAYIVRLYGFTVVTAGNGQEALDLLRKTRPPPCLILLDLMMPVMDGRGFLRERERDPSLNAIPVVIISATDDVPGGIVAALRKPVDLDDLNAILRRYC